MKKQMIITGLLLVAVYMICATSQVFSEEMKIVNVTGYGTNDSEATNDAYEKAIVQVVGIYVDSTRTVIDDKLKEEILTFSAGYIKNAKIVSREHDQTGGVSVKMEITVMYGELSEDIRKGKVGEMSIERLPILPPDQRRPAAKKLLEKAFLEYPSCVFKGEILTKKQQVSKSLDMSESGTISTRDLVTTAPNGDMFLEFDVKYSVDMEKYWNFAKRITPWLEAINTAPKQDPKRVTATGPDKSSWLSLGKLPDDWRPTNSATTIFLCTDANRTGTQSKWMSYGTDDNWMPVFLKTTTQQVDFLDTNGKTVVCGKHDVPLPMVSPVWPAQSEATPRGPHGQKPDGYEIRWGIGINYGFSNSVFIMPFNSVIDVASFKEIEFTYKPPPTTGRAYVEGEDYYSRYGGGYYSQYPRFATKPQYTITESGAFKYHNTSFTCSFKIPVFESELEQISSCKIYFLSQPRIKIDADKNLNNGSEQQVTSQASIMHKQENISVSRPPFSQSPTERPKAVSPSTVWPKPPDSAVWPRSTPAPTGVPRSPNSMVWPRSTPVPTERWRTTP